MLAGSQDNVFEWRDMSIAGSQDNVLEWRDMSICGMLFQ